MLWFTAYLVSVILVPAFFGMFYCNESDNEVKIRGFDSIITLLGFCLLWPITIGFLLFDITKTKYHLYFINRCEEIVRKYAINHISPHDRTNMIVIPENDLKFLLKCYRNKRYELDRRIVGMVRDELMHRQAERSLFK